MLSLIIRRMATAIPSLLGVIVVTFLLTRVLPGDPAAYFAGPTATPETIEEVRSQLGLDQPLPRQFASYVVDLATGNLGTSLTTGQPVLSELARRLPASAELTLTGLALALMVSLPLGVMAAVRQGSWVDHVCRVLSTAGISLPVFFTGLLFVYAFYYVLGWAPAPLGRLDVFAVPPAFVTGAFLVDSLIAADIGTFAAAAAQIALPAATLTVFALAPLTRITRASMLGVLSSDFIRTARAAGLGQKTIVIRYAFRNALLPVVTTMGMVLSFLLGANVLVERVFSWPGIGSYAVEALIASDYAPVQGFVLMMAIIYVLLNLAIDLLYGVIDPRVQMNT